MISKRKHSLERCFYSKFWKWNNVGQFNFLNAKNVNALNKAASYLIYLSPHLNENDGQKVWQFAKQKWTSQYENCPKISVNSIEAFCLMPCLFMQKQKQYACGVEKSKQNVEHYILNCRDNRNLQGHGRNCLVRLFTRWA